MTILFRNTFLSPVHVYQQLYIYKTFYILHNLYLLFPKCIFIISYIKLFIL